MKLLDTSELARQTGIAASALRYYEEKGLIASVGRRGLKRLFEDATIVRLTFISLGKAAGFSLDEIADMIGPDGQPMISRKRLRERVDELDVQIRKLENLRDAISHVADCPHPSHMDCPKFRRLLQASARRKSSSRRGRLTPSA